MEKVINTLKTFPELEINIKFPTCWDGVNLEAKEGVEHVVYADGCDGDSNECFEEPCPDSHPVKMPEIHWYYRVSEYQGGPHLFADGTDVRNGWFCRIMIPCEGLPQ